MAENMLWTCDRRMSSKEQPDYKVDDLYPSQCADKKARACKSRENERLIRIGLLRPTSHCDQQPSDRVVSAEQVPTFWEKTSSSCGRTLLSAVVLSRIPT